MTCLTNISKRCFNGENRQTNKKDLLEMLRARLYKYKSLQFKRSQTKKLPFTVFYSDLGYEFTVVACVTYDTATCLKRVPINAY